MSDNADLHAQTALGKPTAYGNQYDPGLLCPLPRATGRAALGLTTESALPFVGVDVWHNYELSWLEPDGRPRVAIARLRVPADSPYLIESKSLKLYCNGLNFLSIASAEELRALLRRDLSHAAGAPVQVDLLPVDQAWQSAVLSGQCLDDAPFTGRDDHPDPTVLQIDESNVVEETLYSHLLRSNCPVTGQPDWGSVVIRYRGPRLQQAALLRYLVSYREHNDFHEHCVERIFCDIRRYGRTQTLTVYACYTRRGGLDINPWRSDSADLPSFLPRLVRQ